ncbi:MAG: class I SAM-dependent DNA methyltransferase, partial [Ottowia sp.]|nr:class I SAM-dependent DNA methyltransferase [Ottowia sp.]
EYEDIRGEPHAVPAANINPYLVDAPDVVLPRRSKPVCDVPGIGIGSQPIDDGNYLFTTEEKDDFVRNEPDSQLFFHRWLGAVEFLNGYERWCLWLGDASPGALRAMPEAMKRVQAVKTFRLKSKRAQTLRAAATPTHFGTELIPRQPYILLPKVSSERREFIPFGFEQPTTFCSDLVFMLPKGTLFHFGILCSTMHNAWVRAVCGRLKSDFRYSAAIVYNNFPWPFCAQDSEQKVAPAQAQQAQAAIEKEAQAVLDARAAFPGSSLADLYDPLTMPPLLLKAHQR